MWKLMNKYKGELNDKRARWNEHRQKIHFNIFAPRQKKNKNKIVSTVKTKKAGKF